MVQNAFRAADDAARIQAIESFQARQEETVAEQNEFIRELQGTQETTNTKLDEAVLGLARIAEQIDGFIESVASVYAQGIGSGGGSLADPVGEEGFANIRRMVPTGTIILSVQSDLRGIISAGWLPCQGWSVEIQEYPELYDVIGDKFGVPPNNGLFVLPSAEQLFGVGHTDARADLLPLLAVEDDAPLQFLIRI